MKTILLEDLQKKYPELQDMIEDWEACTRDGIKWGNWKELVAYTEFYRRLEQGIDHRMIDYGHRDTYVS